MDVRHSWPDTSARRSCNGARGASFYAPGMTFGLRIRAPELVGRGGWINTGGQEIRLADLRGKVVLLDFWTFCCINCLHVLDELRPLEAKYADVLAVVGVHS